MNALHNVRKALVISLAVIGLGSAALAAQAQAPAAEERHAQMQGKWREHVAKRQATLHDLLKITPAQEPAWSAYLAALKPAAKGERPARADWENLSAPARMEQRIAMAKQHIAAMETRLAALNTFYAVLTPEQKKLFDALSRRGGKHGHGKGHGMRHGMHG